MTSCEKETRTGLSTRGRCANVSILQMHMLLSCGMHDNAVPSHFKLTDDIECDWTYVVSSCAMSWMWPELRDTHVQGLNRVQQAPSVSRAMHSVLHRCQQRLGSWVGSSVVHLGDHNVPNALMFIDKYTQVPALPYSLLELIAAHFDVSPLNSFTACLRPFLVSMIIITGWQPIA